MSHNLSEIIEYLRYDLKLHKIKNKTSNDENMIEKNKKKIPYYEGFKGEITAAEKEKYLIKGKYDIIGTDLVKITELPLGTWTDDYKECLEGWSNNKNIKILL